ncbi:MAG: hypothetical protein WBB24_05145 [Maribacter sp.]
MINLNIPTQLKGGRHDTVTMYCTNNEKSAKNYFEQLKTRLQSVNEWNNFSDDVKAEFTLIDPKSKKRTAAFKKNMLIKIDIPSLGNPSGKGYDWTKIIDVQNGIHQDHSFLLMTLRPCAEFDESDKPISHFYTSASTNTFIVRKIGCCLYAEVHGRNEIENTSDVPYIDIMRNQAVAIGSKVGLGDLNWLGFTKALLEPFKK